MTCAFARVLVTFALLAQTAVLTVWSPSVVVAGTLAGQVIALAIRVTVTFSFAVRTPELGGTLCVTGSSKVSMTTAAFIGPDTHLVFLTGEVPFAERCQAFFP